MKNSRKARKMNKEAVRIAIDTMLEDLQVFEGDAFLEDDEGEMVAIIPYFAHGKMAHHKIPLEAMVHSVQHAINLTTKLGRL